MTQVSKRFVKKQVEERILDLFFNSFSRLQTKGKATLFLEDLLTKTEKIMLAKRLAISFMIHKGYEYKEINDVLKVGDQTIWTVKQSFIYKGHSIFL